MFLIILFLVIASWLTFKLYRTSSEQDLAWNVKWAIAYCYLRFLKFNSKPLIEFDDKSCDVTKNGIGTHPKTTFIEYPRKLCSNINAKDSISFCSASNNGDILVVKLSRRHDRSAEVTVYLKLGSQGEEYHLPNQSNNIVYNTNGKTFTAAGLSFEILEPARCWRIIFNGFLRKRSTSTVDNDKDVIPVKFNLLWHPMYDYASFPQDFNVKAMASISAQQNLQNVLCNPNKLFSEEWYHQFGVVKGTLSIDGKEETEILLRGLKSREYGVVNWKELNLKVSITGILQNGLSFHAVAADGIAIKNFSYGYLAPASNHQKRHIHQWNNELKSLQQLQDKFQLQIKAGDNNTVYNISLTADGSRQFRTVNLEYETIIKVYDVDLNGKKGRCIVEVCKTSSRQDQAPVSSKSVPFLQELEIDNCKHLVLTFDNDQCKSSKIVGGKGASLALMASINGNKSFVVPDGLCLTKKAFTDHLIANRNILNYISSVESVAWNKTNGNLKDECNKLMNCINSYELPNILKEELNRALLDKFGVEYEQLKFAVRSSAIGEDSEELSAAGQNETFLGVKTFNNICEAVTKCWASQFSHRSIEYKRQNGQLLNGGIGVVIQEMVPADVAGVVFTKNPVSGSPSELMIAASYGLGESVVSANVDPDTIIISRTFSDEISIKEKRIGSKRTKIIMEQLGTGTLTTVVDSSESSTCSLSNDMALKLAKIAIDLEKRFGGARDLEWATKNNTVFILQSRPVTSENLMTDFDINHEFDAAPKTDNERYTTANFSEVMPGAVSPLTFSSFTRALFIRYMVMLKLKGINPDLTVIDTITNYLGHLFMDRILMSSSMLSKKKNIMIKGMEIGLHGKLLDEDDVMDRAIERFESTSITSSMTLKMHTILGMFFSKRALRRESAKYKLHYSVKLDKSQTIEETYQSIEKHFQDLENAFQVHVIVSTGSVVWNILVLTILAQGSERVPTFGKFSENIRKKQSFNDFTFNHYTDFGTLIATCNCTSTESGNLPLSIMELANSILEDEEYTKFQAMDPKTATNWLSQRASSAGEKYREFIKRHGHRGYKESDLRMKPYRVQPEMLTMILQRMVKDPDVIKRSQKGVCSTTHKEVLANLKTPLSTTQRMFLRIVMSQAKNATCCREESKSRLMKIADALRRAYNELALRMQHEGFLPDTDLIHFLTHSEIALLIKTRSARILQRARKRQLLFPEMDALILSEFVNGTPKMVKESDINEFENALQVTGCPVTEGSAQGVANIVTSFEQVETIQVGDILVTHTTDIGWSPYFPMLKGLVTEIGGLISHGAVVAREFGLPCVVAAQNATKIFKSGDTIFVNTTKGTVAKVKLQ